MILRMDSIKRFPKKLVRTYKMNPRNESMGATLLYGLLGPSELNQEQSPHNSRKSLKNQLDIFDRKSRVLFLCFKNFGKYFEKYQKRNKVTIRSIMKS